MKPRSPGGRGPGRRRLVAAPCTLLTAAAALALAPAACSHGSRRPAPPVVAAPAVDWPAALGDALRAAGAGRYADADRVLSAFASRYAGSPEAAEALFWRAMFQLDPANHDRSSKAAAATLDAYLAQPGELQHRDDAAITRRVVAALDSLGTQLQAAKAAPPAPPPATPAELKAKDDEIARIRDSLTTVSAELERVRKRLAPRP